MRSPIFRSNHSGGIGVVITTCEMFTFVEICRVTPRQYNFVREYLVDCNATQAMVRAGYSARTANKHAPRLMGHPRVRRLIDAAMSDRDSRVRIGATAMLEGMASEAKSDLEAARENLVDANHRIKAAVNMVRDIERLCRMPPASRERAPSPDPAPVSLDAPPYRSPLSWPEQTPEAIADYDPFAN